MAFWLQYSGINYALFGSHEYKVKYTAGRLLEVLPFASLGLIMAEKAEMVEALKGNRAFAFLVGTISLLIVGHEDLFTTPPGSFGYGGTYIAVYAVLTCFVFCTFPFEKLPSTTKSIIAFLSQYSAGVYFIHFGVGLFWNNVLCVVFGWRENTNMYFNIMDDIFSSIQIYGATSKVKNIFISALPRI